jgi:hypothetical protein
MFLPLFSVSNYLLKHILEQKYYLSKVTMGVNFALFKLPSQLLTLLATANVPLSFWDSAFETAVYLINRLLSKVTKKKSPFETLFNISPDYKLLKIFGCECWPFLRPYNSPKLAFRSQFCVFIGYSKNHLRYKGLHIPSGKFTLLDIWSSMNKFFLFSKSVTTPSPTPSLIPSIVSVPLVKPSTNHINDTCSPPQENSHSTLPNYSPQPLIPFNSPTTSSFVAPTDTSPI